jgi:hypothetical protein
MNTSDARRLAGLFVFAAVLGGMHSATTSAKELFCAVGWRGEFTHIDPTTGATAPTRTDLPHDLQALARSPDGTLYAGRYGSLYTVDPLTGDTKLFLSIDLDIRGMAFSALGGLYVVGDDPEYSDTIRVDDPATLHIINVKDGTWRRVGDLWGDERCAQGLAFSPDGVLYGVVPHDGTPRTYDLFTIDLDDGETHLIGSHHDAVDLSQSLAFTPDGHLYGLGKMLGPSGETMISLFARLDPHTGDIIGPVLTFPGDYRGLELVPEPATLLLLGLGSLVLLSRPRQNRRA